MEVNMDVKSQNTGVSEPTKPPVVKTRKEWTEKDDKEVEALVQHVELRDLQEKYTKLVWRYVDEQEEEDNPMRRVEHFAVHDPCRGAGEEDGIGIAIINAEGG